MGFRLGVSGDRAALHACVSARCCSEVISQLQMLCRFSGGCSSHRGDLVDLHSSSATRCFLQGLCLDGILRFHRSSAGYSSHDGDPAALHSRSPPPSRGRRHRRDSSSGSLASMDSLGSVGSLHSLAGAL